MDAVEYQGFLDELRATLEADPLVLGLVALGSTADETYRDRWSDHDFWVVTSRGAQARYLDTFSWLPRAADILMTVRHGRSYRSVVYADGHQAEYAVFDTEEAAGGKIERYRVLLDRGGVGDLAESIRLETRKERTSAPTRPDLLENFCTLVLTACERWRRGERLSAQRYVQSSIDRLLDLLAAHGGLDGTRAADGLDPRRRLEQTEPQLARELERIVSLAPCEAGVALVDLARGRLMMKAPGLAWEKASAVRRLLREIEESG